MPRPDPAPRRPRDPRLDAFRGAALAMILIDHMPGNPYEQATLRNWGFSDAAEAFFVISGIATALAYGARFAPAERRRNGLWPAVRPLWRRAWTLYQAHVLLTLWAIALFAAGAIVFDAPDLLTRINLGPVFESTAEALLGVPLLTHQLGYVNILPAYAVLLLAAPGAILLGQRWPRALAAGSVALWMAAGIWRLDLPNYPNAGGWFFNPFAWQLVFVVGLLTGLALRRGERLVPRHPALIGLAAGFLLLSLAWVWLPPLAGVLNRQMARLGAMGAPFHLVSHDKTYLALPRLLHVLALVYLVSSLDGVRRAVAHRWAAPLRLLGRHGLLVFAAGTALSLAAQVAMAANPAPWLGWLLPPLGLVASLALAALAERQARGPAPPPVADALGQGLRVHTPAE